MTGLPRIYSFLADKSGCFERIEGVGAGHWPTLRNGAKSDACSQQEKGYSDWTLET